jgi:purine-binding chemotaxis protein CheW
VVAQSTGVRNANAPVGFIVDAVEEVINIAATEIEETPDFGSAQAIECMTGIAKVDGKVKALLDVDRVVARELLNSVEETAQ